MTAKRGEGGGRKRGDDEGRGGSGSEKGKPAGRGKRAGQEGRGVPRGEKGKPAGRRPRGDEEGRGAPGDERGKPSGRGTRGGRGGGTGDDRPTAPRGRGRAATRGAERAGAGEQPTRARGGRSAGAVGRAGESKRGSLPEEIRLQAYLARAGVASRRAREELIREGRVTVDGERAEIGSKVNVGRSQVRVDGALVEPQRVEWLALNKPTGYVTTRDDPRGRRTVYDLIPGELHHLFHVGRLDRDSSGILLLTNDGEAANRLMHPRYGTSKEYWADVEGEPSDETLRKLVTGVELEDGPARALSARPIGETDAGTFRVEIVLEEGRNREVRRMLEAVGHPVARLTRRRFGPIEVGKLRPGHWRRLTAGEIAALR